LKLFEQEFAPSEDAETHVGLQGFEEVPGRTTHHRPISFIRPQGTDAEVPPAPLPQ
jgi:hypothetical protein